MKVLASLLTILLFTSVLWAQKEEYGIASYYSDNFHGKPTASGELYDMNAMTAAHKTLPFGTMIKVTRLDNGKSVQVKVNDRGPHIPGRVVEVSGAAAKMLDLVRDGLAKVVVEMVTADPPKETTAKSPEPPKSNPAPTTETKAEPTNKPTPPKESKPLQPADTGNKSNQKSLGGSSNTKASGEESQPYGLYQMQLNRPEKKGFAVQVAALSTQDAMFRKVTDLQNEWFSNIMVSVEQGKKKELLYKILLGPFPDADAANVYKENLKKNKKMDGFVIDLSTIQAVK